MNIYLFIIKLQIFFILSFIYLNFLLNEIDYCITILKDFSCLLTGQFVSVITNYLVRIMGHSEHHKPFKCEEILLDLVPYPPGPVKAWAARA